MASKEDQQNAVGLCSRGAGRRGREESGERHCFAVLIWQREVWRLLPDTRCCLRRGQLPDNVEKAEGKETDSCQTERGQDAAENFPTIDFRLFECSHQPLAEQDCARTKKQQVNPGKISRDREQRKDGDITHETDYHEKESHPD